MDQARAQTMAEAAASTPRSRTPDTTIDTTAPTPRANPFLSPYSSRRNSFRGSSTGVSEGQYATQRYFHSRRVQKGAIERPWLEKKDPREKWVTIIPLIGLALGFAIAGFLVYDGMKSVVNHNYCLILDEDWSNGFNTDVWTKESEVGGFGNGQFEQTTNTEENVFIQDGNLIIKPTLQDEDKINSENTIHAPDCTSDLWYNCMTSTNVTNGTIVQPVKSGRINAKKGAAIKYGRIEVTATLPEGDWLWPAIWMMPVNATYGEWPRSGEIDILESRGNNYTYPQGGNNIASSALHWGPNPANDAWWRTNNKRRALHTTYAAGQHVFGMEWSEDYIFTYIDSRLLQVLYFNFDGALYKRGQFPLADGNATALVDPWSQTGRPSTPFDQDFYLIINLAVGSTNGWFEDGINGKPWVDAAQTAKRDFWNARDQWLPTWEEKGTMQVHKVQIWQQSGYNGCNA